MHHNRDYHEALRDFEHGQVNPADLSSSEDDEGEGTDVTKSLYLRNFKQVKHDFLSGKTRMDVVPPRDGVQEENRVVAKVTEEAREPSFTLADMIKQELIK